ncbi:MAG: hypothetical protein SGARI_005172 [Bacillariaceae sp.]
MTPAPSLSPTIDFLPESEELIVNKGIWMFMFTAALVGFLCFPFCITKKRRDLCWQRIKERRWISDDTEDDWYAAAMRRRQEQRRHQMEEEQHRFETSRTQEDEIREQFLLQKMAPFTMALSASDIHEMDDSASHSLNRSGSLRSLGSRGSRASRKSLTTSKKGPILAGEDFHDSETVLDMDVEAQVVVVTDVTNETTIKEERSDSLTDDEAEEAVLAFDFDDNHQKIYVPMSGQTVDQIAAKDGATSNRRLESSGCAICLCLFEPEEKITWSANPECPHIFHSDCVLHWYLAVGRKTQKRRLRKNPDMSPDEILAKICEFPMACPCCRQEFCREIGTLESSLSTATGSTDEEDSEDEEIVERNHNTCSSGNDSRNDAQVEQPGATESNQTAAEP